MKQSENDIKAKAIIEQYKANGVKGLNVEEVESVLRGIIAERDANNAKIADLENKIAACNAERLAAFAAMN